MAEDQNLPEVWSGETGDNVLWRQPIPGLGHSSPVVWGDRVYVAGVTGQGSDAAEEARAVLGSIRSTLDAASVGFDAVEEVWVYLADVRDADAVRGEPRGGQRLHEYVQRLQHPWNESPWLHVHAQHACVCTRSHSPVPANQSS